MTEGLNKKVLSCFVKTVSVCIQRVYRDSVCIQEVYNNVLYRGMCQVSLRTKRQRYKLALVMANFICARAYFDDLERKLITTLCFFYVNLYCSTSDPVEIEQKLEEKILFLLSKEDS